jgi:hypothetical protein
VNIWSVSAIVYVVVRTVVAGVLLVLAVRRRVPGFLAAQSISDAAVALLVLAYALHPLRALLGGASVLLFIYFIAWEGLAAAQRWGAIGETPDEPLSDAELLGGMSRWVWDLGGLAPPFIMGVLVAGAIILPGEWMLPGTPSALSCTPVDVVAGDDLTLRMRTPHGGDLGVFTPRRGYLILRSPVAAGSVPPAERFERQGLLALPTESFTGRRRHAPADEPVFADSGKYIFSMSEYRDPSVAFTCAVHYRP